MTRFWKTAVSIGAVCAVSATTSLAQWSTSTTNTFRVGDVPGDNNQPIIAPTSDGGCYILWRSIATGTSGYGTRVQRLDANGIEQWPHNGVLVASDVGASSFTVVGGADLKVASDGSALVLYDNATDSTASGVRQANVQKVSPAGVLLWGSGVAVSKGAYGGAPGAAVCPMPDGGCVVGYTVSPPSNVAATYIYMMRYTSSGTISPGWNPASPPFIFQSGVNLFLTCLQPGDPLPTTGSSPGTFIASWVRSQTQSAFVTQKFTGLGAAASGWSTPITLDSHGLTQHDFPTFVPDNAGGGVYGWHTYANSGSQSPSDAVLQHVLANGSLKFSQPIPLVDPAFVGGNIARLDAQFAYNPTDGSYFLVAEQGPSTGPNETVVVQKFDSSGNRLYSAAGFTVVTQASNPQVGPGNAHVVPTNDGGCVVVGDVSRGFSTVNAVVYAAKIGLDQFGFPTALWSNMLNTDTTTSKGRIATTSSATTGDPLVAFAWPVGSGGGNVIAAARINSATGAPGVVPDPPTIVQDVPATVNACDGGTVTISATVTGTPNMVYQWQRHFAYDVSGNPGAFYGISDGVVPDGTCQIPADGTSYSGTNTATLTITNVHAIPGTYTCSSGVITGDQLNNYYQLLVYNAASDLVTTSGTATINIVACQAGICCQPDGSCTVATPGNPATCSTGSLVVGGTCSPNTCPSGVTGTCCQGSTCVTGVTAAACSGANTAFTIGGTTCNASGNRKTPCCEADFNHSGSITVQDIFDFLSAWFAKNPISNITSNGAGAPTVQSIFDYLAAWFAKGC